MNCVHDIPLTEPCDRCEVEDETKTHHYLEIMRYSPPGYAVVWWASCSCGYKGEAHSLTSEAEKDRATHASQYPPELVHT